MTYEDLANNLQGLLTENVPLAPFTTFRIGGSARWYVEPANIDDVIAIQQFIADTEIPFFILGNGSNVLISDDGWDGLILNLETGFNTLSCDGNIITAEAGVRMAAFVDFAIRHTLAGVEMLAGIPATIGGAVRMNAGCYGGETSDHLLDVGLVRDQAYCTLSKQECDFSYRHSGFSKSDIIVSARFVLPNGAVNDLQEIKRKHLLHRNEVQPVNLPNCGSVFKNPRPRFSAELIEGVGLKGTQIGGAQISVKHANFIVNIQHASATDVIALMNLARKKVFEQTGIILEPEVQLVGFKENPIEVLK